MRVGIAITYDLNLDDDEVDYYLADYLRENEGVLPSPDQLVDYIRQLIITNYDAKSDLQMCTIPSVDVWADGPARKLTKVEPLHIAHEEVVGAE